MTDIDEMVRWTDEAASQLYGPDADAWLARVEGRYAVVLLTLERCLRAGDRQAQAGVRIVVNLEEFWIGTRRAGRGKELLRNLLPVSCSTPVSHAAALQCLQRLADAERGFVEGGDDAEASVILERITGGERRLADPGPGPDRGLMPMSDIEELTAWTAEAGSLVSGPDAAIWLARIEARLPHIFLTLARHETKAPESPEAGLRIIIHLEPFWIRSVRTTDALGWLGRLLPSHLRPTVLRADALMCRGRMQLDDLRFYDVAKTAVEAGQIYRDLGNAAGVARAFDLYCAAEARTRFISTGLVRKTPPLLDLVALTEWTAEAASHLTGPDQAEWLARIDERLPEITFALKPGFPQWDEPGDAALRIAVNLARYWWMRGRVGMAKRMLNDLLISADKPTLLQADGLLALAGLEYAEAFYADVKRSCERACAIYRTLGNTGGLAAALNQLGMAEREAGEYTNARGHHEEARELYLALGEERGAVACLSNLGVVALFEGKLDAAEELHNEALAERRRLGDVRGVASSLGSLGTIARLRQDLERAQEMHEDALIMRRDLGDPWGVAGSMLQLSLISIQRGDLKAAGDLLHEATLGFAKVGDRLGVCEALDARALLTFGEDSPAEAVRLFAVARAARKEIGAPLPPVYCKEVESLLEACKTRLGTKAFDAAWKAGLSPRYSPFPLTPSGAP